MPNSTVPEIRTQEVASIRLPPPVARLYDLAYNFWWSWSPRARGLFRRIDRPRWEHYRNPVELLINAEPGGWETLLRQPEFLDEYTEITGAFDAYLAGPAPLADMPGPVAYFSTEFGLDASLATYSGGLGVLSGDHCKAASDLGLPLVAVGLLYRQGYFHQTLDADGWQQHYYPTHDFTRLPLKPALGPNGRPLEVEVPFPGRMVRARVWVAMVGRVPLLLLDTDTRHNDAADRPITNQLYVQGRGMRLAQELLLGVGGARALAALDIRPAVWHMNEGHSALLQLQRLLELREAGVGVDEALGQLAQHAVFTTHTPVPAGNERFVPEVTTDYLETWQALLDLPAERLAALGGDPSDASVLDLTAFGLRTCSKANAVSQRNAEVVGGIWAPLAAEAPAIPPIEAITNGVHTSTWVGSGIRKLFEQAIGPDWPSRLLDVEAWAALEGLPDEEVWQAHRSQKVRLGGFLEQRLREQMARHGRSPKDLRAVRDSFDVEALTLGFARRFATYKRAHLLFRDIERLRGIVTAAERPVQIIFAGKAHPADRAGQELIRQIFELSRNHGLSGRIVFVENYDMRVARRLVQGVDVWLNAPRPPLEASGTSGMKAALNGALNLSIADGWWPEAFDGTNGWVFGTPVEPGRGETEQDDLDAASLYELLETEVVPLYYERQGTLPTGWVGRMKRAMVTVTPRFSSHRMVREYAERAYAAAASAPVPATT